MFYIKDIKKYLFKIFNIYNLYRSQSLKKDLLSFWYKNDIFALLSFSKFDNDDNYFFFDFNNNENNEIYIYAIYIYKKYINNF